MMKSRKVIRNHICKCIKFARGEGTKIATDAFQKKNIKIVVFGKSYKKADLTKRTGYEYHIMQ